MHWRVNGLRVWFGKVSSSTSSTPQKSEKKNIDVGSGTESIQCESQIRENPRVCIIY